MNSDDNSKLHLLDNRLRTVETQLQERKENAERQHSELMSELREIRKDLVSLKVRSAGISAVISAAVAYFLPHR